MAWKRSSVRTRLGPPKNVLTYAPCQSATWSPESKLPFIAWAAMAPCGFRIVPLAFTLSMNGKTLEIMAISGGRHAGSKPSVIAVFQRYR
jgi:hypothetical protein